MQPGSCRNNSLKSLLQILFYSVSCSTSFHHYGLIFLIPLRSIEVIFGTLEMKKSSK